jgi:hypothetical protein
LLNLCGFNIQQAIIFITFDEVITGIFQLESGADTLVSNIARIAFTWTGPIPASSATHIRNANQNVQFRSTAAQQCLSGTLSNVDYVILPVMHYQYQLSVLTACSVAACRP